MASCQEAFLSPFSRETGRQQEDWGSSSGQREQKQLDVSATSHQSPHLALQLPKKQSGPYRTAFLLPLSSILSSKPQNSHILNVLNTKILKGTKVGAIASQKGRVPTPVPRGFQS